MVDQIQEWLKLIPPEERQRWSWLLDQNTTAFGNPRMIDTPGGGRVWNPSSYPSDLLSGLNTAVREPVMENVVKPALGLATYAAQNINTPRIDWHIGPDGVSIQAAPPDVPGGRRRFFSDQAEVPLQGADFRRYWEENRPTEGLGGAAADIVEDPMSYVGGPIAEAARGLAALPLVRSVPGVARGLGAVAGADEAYSAAMGAVLPAAGRGAKWGAQRIPGVRKLFEDSPGKAVNAFGTALGRAVRDPQAADRLESLVTGSKLGLTGRAVDWEKTIRPAWEAIDTAITESAHPLQQAVLVQQRSKALALENVLEARFEQHRMALEEGFQAGEISSREYARETRDLWQMQARSVRALQLGLIDSVNAVKGHGDELLAGLPGTVDAAGAAIPGTLQDIFGKVGDEAVQSGTLTTALRRASDEALAAHDMSVALTGGKSGVDKVTGLFSQAMGPEGQRIQGLQAQDPFFRAARETAMKEMDTAAAAVFNRYKDVVQPEDLATLDDTARSAFQAAEVELAPFTQTAEQALGGLGEEKRNAILKVWDTDSPVSLPKQMLRVLAARRGLIEQVSPALHEWYRTMGYSLEQRNAAVDLALSSADRLLNEPALKAPEAAALLTSVEDRLNKFGHSGDILAPGDAPKVAANLTTSAFARSLGVKAPHPLLGAAITQLGAWKEQAVISPAFQIANLIGGLVLGEAGGVSGVRVLNLLRHTLPQMKGVILQGKPIDLVFDGQSSRVVSKIFGDSAGMIHLGEDVVGRGSGEVLAGTGLVSGPAATKSARIPLLIRSGIPALTTGGSYWSQYPDDPDRTRNALLVGGAAAAVGAATPHFAFYNQNLSAASEGAMRGAALFTGVEEAIGSAKAGTGIAGAFVPKLEAVLKPTRMTSVGKELTRSDMLPGLNTITGMQTLSDLLPAQKGVVDLPPLGAATAAEAGVMSRGSAASADLSAARTAWTGPPPEGPAPVWPAIPHSDRIQPEVVSQALASLPEAIRGDVTQKVGRIGVRDFGGDGGKFVMGNPGRPGTVFVEPDQIDNVRTIAHELLHAHTIEADFSKDFLTRWAEARYPAGDLAAMKERITKGQGFHAFGYNGNEDLTVGIERYLFEPESLPPAQRTVIGEYLASLTPPPIDVAPPATPTARVLGLHTAGPSPVASAGEGVDVEAIRNAFVAADGHLSPDALEQIALKHGATAEQAALARSAWDQDTTIAYNAGIKKSNDIHFDYSDVNNLVAGLRDTGIMPFLTWQTKALPRFATLLLQNPRYIIAIDGLNNLSDSDIQEAGLTSRYARLAKMGVLGDFLAEQILGRTEGTVLAAPLKALFPYGDVGKDDTLPDDANPLERGLAALRPFGLSPGPLVTTPLMATGAIGELPIDLTPTSRYLRPLSTQLTGREADPEMLTRRLMAAARTATGAGAEPTVTGDFLRDRAIRQRIAELAVEETGKAPAGPYLLAMDDPASQIWLRARAQVDRQRMGEAGLAAVLPFRTKFLSDTEAQVRALREATGVGPDASAARRAQPATAAELAAAATEVKRKPLKVGETLEDRAATNRWIAAETAAERISPLTKTLSNLGGNQAIGRQWPEWMAFQRRVRHMSPKRKGQLTAEFLGQRPALKAYVATHDLYN